MCCWRGTNLYPANNAENEITEIMICSKSAANSSGLCKRNGIDGVYWYTGQVTI